MTSGYDAAGGSYGNGNADGSSTPQNPSSPLFAPGTSSAYWDDAMNAFGIALGEAAGTVIANVFNDKIGARIGMKKVGWPTRGNWNGKNHSTGAGSGRGVTVTPEDMARLGYLMLRMGRWNGTQVLSENWVKLATRTVEVPSSSIPNHPRSNNKVSGRYGFNWWVNGEGKLFGAGIPRNAFGAYGAMGNFMVVVPDWELVVVRLGTKSGGDSEEFVKRIMEGAQP
jgi:CubicO group peptidase (beta-lactamase class C family)